MPLLDRGGWSLHYDVAGRGDDVVIFTHGLAANGSTWAAQVEGLAPHHRVVTWDLRAHARSGSPDEACTPAVLAGDLAALAREVGAGRPVHAVGHSAGGVVAMRFAIDHSVLARSLILVGTASEANARAFTFYESLAVTAEHEGSAAVVRRLGTGDESVRDPEPRGLARVARAMGSLHTTPITSELDSLRCPVLIVVGEKDFLGVGGSVIMSRRIAGARLEIVPERGHPIFREDPAGFNRLLLDFLRAH
jgi:pimeloyl-ACP methyl ester carboxylesterase